MSAEKMKIAMICHFSNPEVREHLTFSNRKLYRLICRLTGRPVGKSTEGDVAAWDTYIINSLKDREDVELHVISASNSLKDRKCDFQIGNVHYCFFRASFSTFLKHIFPAPQIWHFFNPTRLLVQRIVKRINPDIVALVGAENPHYSDTILGLKGYPIIIKAQTVYNNPDRKSKTGGRNAINAYVEKRIFLENKYFSIGTKMHQKLFRQFNPTAYNLRWRWCATYPEINTDAPKEFDFVNFAMGMNDSKGFPDSIKALAIVKQKYPNVKLNLEGAYNEVTLNRLKALASECGVEENVSFTQFFQKQEDAFRHIVKSRFALLPCKMDYISSTMSQAMHFGLPLVCYRTEGTPTLNVGKQRVLIAENSNIDDLASKMLEILDNPELANKLSSEAKEYIDGKNNQSVIAAEMMSSFKAVIANYRNGTVVPKDVLYEE